MEKALCAFFVHSQCQSQRALPSTSLVSREHVSRSSLRLKYCLWSQRIAFYSVYARTYRPARHYRAAFVSIYGFVSDPRTVADHVAFLAGLMPTGGIDLIRTQLNALATKQTEALSLGFVTGLAVALWSANNGIKALFDGTKATN